MHELCALLTRRDMRLIMYSIHMPTILRRYMPPQGTAQNSLLGFKFKQKKICFCFPQGTAQNSLLGFKLISQGGKTKGKKKSTNAVSVYARVPVHVCVCVCVCMDVYCMRVYMCSYLYMCVRHILGTLNVIRLSSP